MTLADAIFWCCLCGAAAALMGLSLWAVRPARRWAVRCPLAAMVLAGVVLYWAGVALSLTRLDVFYWSPMLLIAFAFEIFCAAVFAVRAFEWYLWAYRR